MDDREKREFQAGLAADVDAWLRGEPTRRTFIKRFGQMTGMLALSGTALSPFINSALAQAQMQLEDPSTPLGKARRLRSLPRPRVPRTAPPTVRCRPRSSMPAPT